MATKAKIEEQLKNGGKVLAMLLQRQDTSKYSLITCIFSSKLVLPLYFISSNFFSVCRAISRTCTLERLGP